MDDLEPRLAVATMEPNETLPFISSRQFLVESLRTEIQQVKKLAESGQEVSDERRLRIEQLKNEVIGALQQCVGTEQMITYGAQEFLVRKVKRDDNSWVVELGLGWTQPETGLSAGTVSIRFEDLLQSLDFVEKPPQPPQSL